MSHWVTQTRVQNRFTIILNDNPIRIQDHCEEYESDAITTRPLRMVVVEDLNDPLADYIREHRVPGLMPVGDIRVFPSGVVMPREFANYVERIKNFTVRPDDVWVISYPKCGTTWTQEMVWLIGNDLDYESAKNKLLLQRFPFLEAVGIISSEQLCGNDDDDWVFNADTISFTEELPSPRFIKSHLPVSLLPDQIWTVKPKMIYVTRNPKDAAVSYYHHHRLWNGYNGSYPIFMQAFLQDRLVYSPFWEHVVEYKKLENEPNLLINSFEEMKKDLKGVVRKTSAFLNKTMTEEQVERLADHLSFGKMKDNRALNGEEMIKEVKQRCGLDPSDPQLSFIRKGQVDSWKEEMSPDIANQFDVWSEKKKKELLANVKN